MGCKKPSNKPPGQRKTEHRRGKCIAYWTTLLFSLPHLFYKLVIKVRKASYSSSWIMHNMWKLIKMSHFNFWILAFSINSCLFKVTCLVTLFDHKLQVFNNSSKWTILRCFWLIFVHSKCKRISLRSQYWIRLFLWFSNTVLFINLLKYTVLDF